MRMARAQVVLPSCVRARAQRESSIYAQACEVSTGVALRTGLNIGSRNVALGPKTGRRKAQAASESDPRISSCGVLEPRRHAWLGD